MTPNTVDLTGRTALVTGGGRGLGWGVAVALARAGARVCITDVDEAGIARAVRDVEAEKVTLYPDDFRARQDWRASYPKGSA